MNHVIEFEGPRIKLDGDVTMLGVSGAKKKHKTWCIVTDRIPEIGISGTARETGISRIIG